MTPTHTRQNGKLYRYYIASNVNPRSAKRGNATRRVPAAEIEGAVLSQIKIMVQSPEIIVATWKAAKPHIKGLSEQQVRDYLIEFSALWSNCSQPSRLVSFSFWWPACRSTPTVWTSRCVRRD